MSRSKNKSGSPTPSAATSLYVAVHQDHLMEAFARGFLYTDGEPFVAEAIATQEALERAMGTETWGSVVLVEIPQTMARRRAGFIVSQPLLLVDCIAVWAPSDSALAEIDARLQTFDDTVPTALELRVGESLFPAQEHDSVAKQQDNDSLSLPFGDSAPAVEGNKAVDDDAIDTEVASVDATNLEKVAGAVALLRWRLLQLATPIEVVSGLFSIRSAGQGLAGFAQHVHSSLADRDASKDDNRIFAAAALMLKGLSPKQGIDPMRFARDLEDRLKAEGDEGAAVTDMEVFVETIQKVIDNRIELSESKIDDRGRIGQRALMLFLLAPRSEELQRWIGARREVGRNVSLLASVLSGMYCGLGGIPREIKGQSRSQFLAISAAGRAIASGDSPSVEVSRRWDDSAALQETLVVSEHVLVDRVEPPSPVLVEFLSRIRHSGRRAEVEPESGEVTVEFDSQQQSLMAEARIGASAYRLPASETLLLTFKGRPSKRGQLPRKLLETLLDGCIRPVVARISLPSVIELDVEVDLSADAGLGLEALAAAVRDLQLVPLKSPKTKQKRSVISPTNT